MKDTETINQAVQMPTQIIERHTGIPPWVAVLMAVSVLSLAASVVFVTRGTSGSAPERAPAFIVVQGSGTERTAEQPAANKPSEPAAVRPAPEPEAANPARRKKAASRPHLDPAMLRSQPLTRAFAKQKSRVESCLDQHPADVEGITGMAVRITLNPAGAVVKAESLPPALASTSAGACIKSAVTAMTFAAQTDTITFRAAITASKE